MTSSPQQSPQHGAQAPRVLSASPEPGQPGLHLVLCPRWEDVSRQVTATLLAESPGDPFATHVVVTDSPAARRALSQELASAAGISSGVDFIGLHTLRRRLEEDLLGIVGSKDPWRSRGLAAAVLEVMDANHDEHWFAPVAMHLGASSTTPEARPGRRTATADRIAQLLVRYCRTAPELIRAWTAGDDVLPDGTPLDERHDWQPQMWRRVRSLLPVPDPVSRHDQLLQCLDQPRDQTDRAPLLLVNQSPCSPLDRELVTALARTRPVTLWQVAQSHPHSSLAQAWGATEATSLQRWTTVATSTSSCSTHGDGELLPPWVEIHASHGPDRQVEVLRERLCGLFEDDPTLQPRDVIVACTDLDEFAPLVRAAFCLDPKAVEGTLHPGHGLRVQVSRASVSQPNQVLATLRLLLGLAGERASSQDLVDLCSSMPVRHAFGLDDDQLERITRLVAQANIRWGLDGYHRAAFGLDQVRQSTWLAGLDRILTGIAMGPEPLAWLGTALPVEQVDSTDVLAAGALAELVSRTRKLVAQWRTPATANHWVERLQEALDLLVDMPPEHSWQITEVRTELAELADQTSGRTALLDLPDMETLFDRLLPGSGGRPNFGNGSLLFARLEDLGRVPHRVVVVLGLDDQRFPRRLLLDGDDLTATSHGGDPETGPRARSRQLLLDAAACARERLVVVHQGLNPRTNEAVPEPVAVVDLVTAATASPRVRLARHQHTLQPQSSLNFHSAQEEPPFSFDVAAAHGARARQLLLSSIEKESIPLWQADFGPLADESTDLDLTDLVDFYRHPARELLRRRLGVTMTAWRQELHTDLPVEPNGLEEWAIGERMVRLALDGLAPGQVAAAERLRGALPPGQLGSRTLEKLMPTVARVVDCVNRERDVEGRDLDCSVQVSRGGSLSGRVRIHGSQCVRYGFSRTNAVHLLQAWFDLLALSSCHPSPPTGWRSVHIGRDAVATLTAPPPEQCVRLLDELVRMRDQGLRRLLPLPVKTAAVFTGATPLRPYRDHDPQARAVSEFRYEHDSDWARFMGPRLDVLRSIERIDGDPGPIGPSRFENLADWLFTPLREHLSVGNLR
ncbi:exodeoxyribonuclease V subunit gamma [Luteococcus sp. Sow4_B9]|uniref:exodeoxyribonuclease V subunit gamma n=1 Tax=Luteococcus sp. Sow4_B9 TaxID=3438792 RepID=UPI003F9DE020